MHLRLGRNFLNGGGGGGDDDDDDWQTSLSEP
jgi:hypothetical protein